MRCRKAAKYISRRVDGDLSGREAARLDRHLESCGECRALAEEVGKIAGAAAGLESPGPSDNVWKNVRAELVLAGREPAREKYRVGRRPLFGLSVPALRYAGAAALAVVLVASGLVIGSRLGRQGTEPGRPFGRDYTLAKLDEAESHYQQAIRALGEAFAAQRGALAPQVAELFDRNLSVIDATIQACRAAVLAEPDDLQARNYLLAAYTEKVTLLDSALDLQRKGRDAGSKGRIL
jgi:anti-sigma factor RsiW